MSESLPYDEIQFDKNFKLENILNTSDGRFFFQLVCLTQIIKKKKPIISHLLLKIKKIIFSKLTPFMNKKKPNTYTQSKKLICGWTDKKNYFIQYRMVNFYVRHGLVIEKVPEAISFKQSKWLEKYVGFITQKISLAKNDFEKDLYKLPNNPVNGKIMETLRNRIKKKNSLKR